MVRKKRLITIVIGVALCIILMPSSVCAKTDSANILDSLNRLEISDNEEVSEKGINEIEYVDSKDGIVVVLRNALINRQDEIYIGYKSNEEENIDPQDFYNEAIRHTGDPKAGDYLRYNIISISNSIKKDNINNEFVYLIKYHVKYNTSLEEEEEIDSAIEELLSKFNKPVDDVEAVKQINEYLSTQVEYDYPAWDAAIEGNVADWHPFSAYGALIENKAVCSGYSLLFYRLALELGIDARVVEGLAQTGGIADAHAWNLVAIDNEYYYLDVTWNATGNNSIDWFLNGKNDFVDHFPYDDCAAMLNNYPLAESKYKYEKKDTNYENGFEFTTNLGIATITAYCLNDKHVVVPDTIGGYKVEIIQRGTFENNPNVESIEFSEGIKRLGRWSVHSCPNLKTIKIPSTVNTNASLSEHFVGIDVGDKWIENCLSLEEFIVSDNNDNIQSIDGVIYSKDLKQLGFYPSGKMDKKFIIPNGVESIIADSCRDNMFLEEVVMPDTVKYIGYWSFYNDISLRKINISNNCKTIAQYAFSNSKISSLSIPASTTAIINSAFEGMSELKEFYVDSENPEYHSKDGVLFYNDCLLAYPSAKEDDRYIIDDTVKSFGWHAFSESKLKEIVLPEGIESIPIGLFNNCSLLENVVIPNGVKHIEKNAFSGCDELRCINLPNTIETIDIFTFDSKDIEIHYNGTKEAADEIKIISWQDGDKVVAKGLSSFFTGKCYYKTTLGHDWDEGEVIKQPTCTDCGEMLFRCAEPKCDESRVESIKALGHDLAMIYAVEATCVDEGNSEYYKCARCNKCFADETGNNEITENSWIISKSDHVWNSDYTVDKKPTCIEEGSRSVHCQNCDAVKDSETIRAAGHKWDEGKVTAEPTCEQSGEKEYTCETCGEKKTEAVGATGHKLGDWQSEVTPTCETAGTEVRRCANCDYMETAEIAAVGHAWFIDKSVDKEPTCTEEGSKSIHCATCDKIKDGSTEVIPKAEHAWNDGEITKEPACGVTGEKTYTCDNCGETKTEEIAGNDHSWNSEYTTDREASCTEDGQKSIHCSKCDAVNDESVKAIPAEGHKWDEGKVTAEPTCEKTGEKEYTCETCGDKKAEVIEATGHVWNDGEITKEPACGVTGEKTYTCDNCSETKTEEIAGNDHSWNSEYTTDREASCTEDGQKSIHCSKCDAVKDGSAEAIPAAGHKWDEGKVTAEPTCDKAGEKEYTCEICGDKKTEKLEATGHKLGDWQSGVTPTCETAGTEVRRCANCDYVETAEIAAVGHAWFIDKSVDKEPTCTEEGSKSIHCATCDKIKDGSTEVIPKAEHAWNDGEITKEPACGVTGEKTYTCDNCGETKTEEIAGSDHSWNSEYTTDREASCTEDGQKSIHCSKCDAVKDGSAETIPAEGHRYGEWEEIQSPACESEGAQQRTCSVCGHVETKNVDAKGHEWNSDYTLDREPTCTEEGSKSVHCKNCDVVKDSQSAPAKGHEFGDWTEIESAKCETEGTEQRTCSVCRYSETRALAANGHAWDSDYTVDKKPTCTEEGSRSVHCQNCDAVRDSETIQSTGHKWDEGRVTAEPTCDKAGEKEYTCQTCGDKKTDTLDPREHNWNSDYTVDKEPGCIEDGQKSIHCADCSVTKDTKSIPAKGHEFGDWTVIESAQCESDGSEQRTCSVCGMTETNIVDSTGHDWNSEYTVDQKPTCQTEGSKSIHCKNCDATKDPEMIPVVDHSWTDEITPASASTEGEIREVCSECGEQGATNVIPMLGTIKLSGTSYAYNGSVKKPTVVVTDADGQAVSSDNYSVTYSNSSSKAVGKYTVKITLKNRYEGSKSLTYNIVPAGTSITKLTRAKKAFTVKWTKKAYTGYQIRYSLYSSMSSAKTVNITKASTYYKKISKLKAKKTYYVQVRTYKTVSGTKYYSAWSTKKSVKTK